MDERAALFSNVLNDPADITARLVLADWLEEHGEDQFGRFLRAGVVSSRYRDAEYIDDPDYYAALRVLAGVATGGAPARWLSALGVGPSPLTGGDWAWDNAGDRVSVRVGGTTGVFTRGLLSELVLPLADWFEFAPRARAAWPVELGTDTGVPGLAFTIGPAAG